MHICIRPTGDHRAVRLIVEANRARQLRPQPINVPADLLVQRVLQERAVFRVRREHADPVVGTGQSPTARHKLSGGSDRYGLWLRVEG